MEKSKETIISEITNYIKNCGGDYSTWYAGITNDAKQRLFSDHNVDEEKGNWVWRRAASADIAREIEKYFLDLGADGGPGGGNDDSDIIYVYKKTSYTKE